MVVNLSKTKVVVFNAFKNTLLDFHFFYRGSEIEITIAYTILGIQFISLGFNLIPDAQPRLRKGYGSLSMLEQ
jgi:hypothetical protein